MFHQDVFVGQDVLAKTQGHKILMIWLSKGMNFVSVGQVSGGAAAVWLLLLASGFRSSIEENLDQELRSDHGEIIPGKRDLKD